MPTYRFPVLVLEDHQGFHSAFLAESGASAFAGSAADAVSQLKELLEWQQREQPWMVYSDFQEAGLVRYDVTLRPEYVVDGRAFPCDDLFTLPVIGVRGRQEEGLRICTLPTLGLRFYYHEGDDLRQLVTHYVQTHLRGLEPRTLSRFLPPRTIALDEILMRVSPRSSRHREETKLPNLEAVAEPLDGRGARRLYTRPWERDKELAAIEEQLRQTGVNLLIVGEGGAGKTSALVEAVRRVQRRGDGSSPADATKKGPGRQGAGGSRATSDDSETHPGGPRFWMTTGSRLIAGMQYLGQWQERCEKVIDELSRTDGVLCVAQLLELARLGGEGPGDSVAAFLAPYLRHGELRIVAEATPAELEACRRLVPGLVDLFQIVKLEPMDRRASRAALLKVAETLGRNLKVQYDERVIDLTHALFRRFLPYQALPGQASGFLQRLFSRAARATGKLSPEDVIEAFTAQTGLPEALLRDEVPLDRDEVFEALRREVVGQEAACGVVADLVTTFKAGLNDPQRPVGVLLFCGPTGVGKTELAKALSRWLFGHGEQTDRLIRVDMSEYATTGSAERLITGPDGEPSSLIRQVRQQPFMVVLLDEVEKAAPEVFDALLGVFDEGRLTDRFGRTTSFRSAILIMTSNLGASKSEAVGFGDAPPTSYEAEAMAFFRPEFFNRFDAVVTFHPLSAASVTAITRLELERLAKREGLVKAGLKLVWGERLVERLAAMGYDARYGARPLQRTIEAQVVAPLSRFLVEHPELRDGAIGVDVGAAGEIRVEWRGGER